MKKRILSLLLALCMILSLLPVVALAADTKPSIQINYYNSSKTIAPGGDPLYWVNVNYSETNNPKILGMGAASPTNWNVKLEYPADGIPTITLKNVDINNIRPLHFCAAGSDSNFGSAVTSDFKLILEGTNKVASTEPSNAYPIFFNIASTSTVTITGDGTLEVSCSMNGALIRSKGNLILDDVDISVDVPAVYGRDCVGIEAVGNMTVNGGSLRVIGYNPYDVNEVTDWDKYRPLENGLKVGGNLTVENGADVKVYGATSNAAAAPELVHVGGTFAIKNSDVEIGILKGSFETVLGANSAPTMDVTFADGYYTVKTSTTNGTYDPDTDTFTAPAEDKQVSYTDINDVTLSGLNYFKVEAAEAPAAPPAFAESQVVAGNDLTLRSRISKAEVDAAGGTQIKVERLTADGMAEPFFVPLTADMVEDGYYVYAYEGIAAKEMGDEISLTVCDANGEAVSVTKQDSILAYAMRMLEGDDALLNTLLVDMLNYGAMAQEQFNYNKDYYVSNALSDAQKALGTQQMAACANTKATVVTEAGYTADVYQGTSFILNYNIEMAMRMSAEMGEDSYAKVTFTNYLGQAQEVKTVNAEKLSDGTYAYCYDGIVAADGRCMVTWTFYKEGGVKVATVTDSMEQYVGRNVEALPYLAQLMNYSDAALAYFTAQ